VEVLAPVAVGTVSLQEIFLTRLGLVVGVEMHLALHFVLAMSEGTPIAKLTSTSGFPILTHLSLQFPGVILHESLLFLQSLESLLLWLNIYFEFVGGIRGIKGHTGRGSIGISSVFLLITITAFWGIGLSGQTIRLLLLLQVSVILDGYLKIVVVVITTSLGSDGSGSQKSIRKGGT